MKPTKNIFNHKQNKATTIEPQLVTNFVWRAKQAWHTYESMQAKEVRIQILMIYHGRKRAKTQYYYFTNHQWNVHTFSITVSVATTIRIYLDLSTFKCFKGLQAEVAGTTVGNKCSCKGSLSLWLDRCHDVVLSPRKISNWNIRWETGCHNNIISPPSTQKRKKKKLKLLLIQTSFTRNSILILRVPDPAPLNSRNVI